MATYNYFAVTAELVDQRIIPAARVFQYRGHQLAYCFHQLFQFAQVNLSEVCLANHYNIEPARFYYADDPDVNARAIYDPDSEYYVIEVNRGTLEQLFALFCDTNSIFDNPALLEYQQLNEILEAAPHQVSLSYLLFQNAGLFTYYHELGHLIQYTNQVNGVGRGPFPKAIHERYTRGASVTFDPLDHLVEYDADLHGANSVAFHILDMWRGMGSEQTEANLRKLTVASLVSIMGYITLLWGDFDSLYFEEHDHPHPLIRIYWILTVIVERISAHQPTVDHRGLIAEALRVLNVYYQHLGRGDVAQKLTEPLLRHYPDIMAYADGVIRQAQTVSYLATNTIHRR